LLSPNLSGMRTQFFRPLNVERVELLFGWSIRSTHTLLIVGSSRLVSTLTRQTVRHKRLPIQVIIEVRVIRCSLLFVVDSYSTESLPSSSKL
jgi:Na+-translocating ferredoxin:NAD+ oxidoreductase RnfE subunit